MCGVLFYSFIFLLVDGLLGFLFSFFLVFWLVFCFVFHYVSLLLFFCGIGYVIKTNYLMFVCFVFVCVFLCVINIEMRNRGVDGLI